MAPPSALVTYQGDARKPDESRPYEIAGFPFSFPVQEPVELTEDFVKSTFNREDFRDFVTFLFDGEHAVYNIHLKSPRFLVAWPDEDTDVPPPAPAPDPDPTPDPDPVPESDTDDPGAEQEPETADYPTLEPEAAE